MLNYTPAGFLALHRQQPINVLIEICRETVQFSFTCSSSSVYVELNTEHGSVMALMGDFVMP